MRSRSLISAAFGVVGPARDPSIGPIDPRARDREGRRGDLWLVARGWLDRCRPVNLPSTIGYYGAGVPLVHAILGVRPPRTNFRHGFLRSHGPGEDGVSDPNVAIRLTSQDSTFCAGRRRDAGAGFTKDAHAGQYSLELPRMTTRLETRGRPRGMSGCPPRTVGGAAPGWRRAGLSSAPAAAVGGYAWSRGRHAAACAAPVSLPWRGAGTLARPKLRCAE
jgi:hypothetical protein